MDEAQPNTPAPQPKKSKLPGLFNGVFLFALVAGALVIADAPILRSDPPDKVLASERYRDVSHLADEMDALIEKIEALNSGAKAPDKQP